MAAAAQVEPLDWSVTEEKVAEAVRRIVAAVDPLAIIAFGSRVRGQHGPESDLDLAVILDLPESEAVRGIPPGLLRGLRLSVDLLPVAKERFDRFRPWVSSVHYNIDREGIRLYECGSEPAGRAVIHQIC